MSQCEPGDFLKPLSITEYLVWFVIKECMHYRDPWAQKLRLHQKVLTTKYQYAKNCRLPMLRWNLESRLFYW